MKQATFRSTWLPLGLAVISLLVLNLGLYTQLASQAVIAQAQLDFPYAEDFASLSEVPYNEFGGDWEIRDEMLVQMSTSGFDLTTYIPIEIPPEQPYTFDATLRYLGGSMGGGLIFNAQQTTSRQQSHMARFNVDAGQLWLIYGYFGDDSNFIGQGSTLMNIPPDDANPHQMRVQVNGATYALFVDDVPIANDIPIMYQGGAVGFISATSQVSFDDVRVDTATESIVVEQVSEVQTVPEQTVPEQNLPEQTLPIAEETVVLTDSFDAVGTEGDPAWLPISGDWLFTDGSLVQQQAEGFDLSTIYQTPFTTPITVNTTFQHRQGAGGGILFNLPTPNSKNGGHMVRYFEDGSIVAWGYFDENGVFNGQGSTDVTLAGDGVHSMSVIVGADTYSVVLDGSELVNGIPINNPVLPAYIGLLASQSVVEFDDVNVFTVGEAPIEEITQTANIDAQAASGNWVVEGGIISQVDTEGTDYVAGTGLAGEQFTVSVNIALPPDNPDAGAGLIFHMGGRDDRSSGHMVRFGSGGQELFWGRYDADGNFTGEGGIPLSLSEQDIHNLLLIVRNDTFSIEVDGDLLVESIPIQQSGGWIGLVSFSGPVTFSDINLQLGE